MRVIIAVGFLLLVQASAANADGVPPANGICSMEGGWRTIFSDPQLTVYSRRVPGSKVLAFGARGELEAPIEQIMEVMRRVEIVEEWMPDIREKFTLEVKSDVEIVTYSSNRLPFPFSDRELILHNSVHLDKVRKYIVLEMRSIDYNGYPIKRGRSGRT